MTTPSPSSPVGPEVVHRTEVPSRPVSETWPCRSCGMILRACTEEPDPLGVCCAVCGQAARGNHGEYEWQTEDPSRPVAGVCPSCSAKAGEDCLNDQGRPVPWRHVDRKAERWFDVAWCGEFIGNSDWVCDLRAGHAEPCENARRPRSRGVAWQPGPPRG